MNRNQQGCDICNLSAKPNKKILSILKRLLTIFKNNLSKLENLSNSDDVIQKQDYFMKLVDYLLLDIESSLPKSKANNCQKHQKLRRNMAQYLKLNIEQLELLSQKVSSKIMKGKFELNMVLHLSKNIAKSKWLQRSNFQKESKITEKASTGEQQKQNPPKQNLSKLKVETATFQNKCELQLPQKQKTNCLFEDENEIRKGDEMVYVDGNNLWGNWIEQYNLSQMLFPQVYYYSIQ